MVHWHGIQSRLLLLPSELKHHIAELSSHDSLTSLARTHTAYRIEAEQALYRTLSNPSLECLETLAMNSEKASFVRFLTWEYVYYNMTNDFQQAISYLLNALVNMHSLSDFRLRLGMFRRRDVTQPWIDSLDKILCNHHFRLQTLYCNNFLDLSQIIESQTELQILGIYQYFNDEVSPRFLGTLKRFQNFQLHLPVVFALKCDVCDNSEKIIIFPAFYSIDRYPTIYQVLADKDQSSFRLADASNIFGLSIYLVDSCDIPGIHMLTKNMTMRFPGLTSLTFCFENPCEISSQEIKTIISLFPDLFQLKFVRWPSRASVGSDNGDKSIPENIKIAHAEDWELACPGLSTVLFIDGSTLQRRFGKYEWVDSDFF